MGLFKNKTNKTKYVVKERSKDDIPYQIPNLFSAVIEKDPSTVIVSPYYGSEIDEAPAEIRESESDITKFDPFRDNPIGDKAISEKYYEFMKVPSLKKKEEPAPIKEEVKEEIKEEIKEEKVLEVKEEEPALFVYNNEDDEENEESVSQVDKTLFEDFFGATIEKPIIEKQVEVKEEVKETIIERKETQRNETLIKPIERTVINTGDYTPEEFAIINSGHKSPSFKDFKLPPFSMLKDPAKIEESDTSWIDDNIRTIDQNLKAFKIDGQVVEHTSGPTFTRYSIMLGAGVSGSKIESIQNDLQRALQAQSIRIENPIPGKPYVGIEVPNKVRRSVNLKELLDRKEFIESTDPTLIPVGLDVEGNCKFISIASLPHGLVAGSSGSGKSVFLNTIIMSLIYKNTPDDVRFFFIDPKKVDLQAYAKIPHLLSPIVDDVKGGITSMKWLIEEMERRFALFRILKVSNLKGYREAIKTKKEFSQVPYIIAIIDEAGDFLMNGGNEAMDLVTKLIQKCRAAGIHLFISTQKPVAKIMSTTIKSNASGRFALRVTSAMDSQVILDAQGADKLLGNGDMIFQSNGASARFQSAYVSDSEIADITTFIEKQCPQDFFFNPTEIEKSERNNPGTASDELVPDIARYVVETGKCSINQITKDFGIGYNRASDIVKVLEYYKIVEDNGGSTKAREILVDEYQLEDILRHMGM